jgi:Ser/Thr protein kinase RdoA (MazF antagonist)
VEAERQAEQLRRIAIAALPLWPLDVADVTPIKVRENAVFAVQLRGGTRVALRVHRLGYHSDDALRSEFLWCDALAAQGIEVPRAVPSRAGRPFEVVAADKGAQPRQVDIFEWIDGQQLGTAESGVGSDDAVVARNYRTIGELAARMHNQSAAWKLPAGFTRHAWDAEGLMGERPRWGRFWELDALSPAQRLTFERLRTRLRKDLMAFGADQANYGLIHADLVPENVLVGPRGVRIIDFDDAGFGWHLFELATTLYFIRRESCYPTALASYVTGYRQHRRLSDEDLRRLPMFLAARGTTYLGWVHTRQGEPTADELTPALIELAAAAADDYLSAAEGS